MENGQYQPQLPQQDDEEEEEEAPPLHLTFIPSESTVTKDIQEMEYVPLQLSNSIKDIIEDEPYKTFVRQDEQMDYSHVQHHDDSQEASLFLLQQQAQVIEERNKRLLELSLAVNLRDSLRFFLSQPGDLMTSTISEVGSLRKTRDYTTIREPFRIIGSRGRGAGQFQFPSGIGRFNDGFIVCDKNTCRMQIFDGDGEFIRDFSVASINPNLVVVADDGEIWFTAYNDEAYVCYSNEGTYTNIVHTTRPFGVAVTKEGHVITSCGHRNVVRALTRDGQELWSSTGNDLNYSCGLVITPANEIAVCDFKNNRVQFLSVEDGRYLRHFDVPNGPKDIDLLPNQQEFVVCCNNVLHIVSMQGELLHHWGLEGVGPGEFGNSWSVAALSNERIAVTDNNNHRVQIF